MSQTSNSHLPASPPPGFLKAVEKILRALVRLLLAKQVTYPHLSLLLKRIYVEVADAEFRLEDKRQSDCRVHLLTGVHRKDVKALRSATGTTTPLAEGASLGARLLATWMADPRYRDAEGAPRSLPLKADGSEPCFEMLVTQVVKQDVRPRVVLDEWLRLGVAHLDDRGYVTLNTGAFTPVHGFEEKAFFFGKNLQDHIQAGAANLMGRSPPFFDRSVYYDGLSQASITELNRLAETLGMQALVRMNEAARTLQTADQGQVDANHRMNFGIFQFNSGAGEYPQPPAAEHRGIDE